MAQQKRLNRVCQILLSQAISKSPSQRHFVPLHLRLFIYASSSTPLLYASFPWFAAASLTFKSAFLAKTGDLGILA
ncbi:MAG: hypothetical protein WA783_15990 [Phormidesmis sp.]